MASQLPFPLLPPKSTELRMEHFDEHAYSCEPSTILFKFIDALCGDAGAGSLKKEIFLQRLSGALDSIYGTDLDYIFGNMRFLSRATSEAYEHDPMTDMLTSPTWDDVMAKDAQYRNRIREFFVACSHGNTVDGIRQAVHAAVSTDCQVMESWRYIDNFGISDPVGRAGIGTSWVAVDLATGQREHFASQSLANSFISGKANWTVQECKSRSEVTVVPHKTDLTPKENRLMLEMLSEVVGIDTVLTVDPNGLAVHSPVSIRAIAADSTYFQVEKEVTGTPDLESLPPPEILAVDLNPSENWLRPRTRELAPYAYFNITSEYSYYYLVSGGKHSPIDNVSYGTLGDNNRVTEELPFEWYEQSEQFDTWQDYEVADSPDNYPGGKYGLTPSAVPALNKDRSPYQFPYASQQDYLDRKKAEVVSLGGQANDLRYRLPIQKTTGSKRTFTPDLAIAYTAPTRESTVTSSWTSRKPRYFNREQRSTSLTVRS